MNRMGLAVALCLVIGACQSTKTTRNEYAPGKKSLGESAAAVQMGKKDPVKRMAEEVAAYKQTDAYKAPETDQQKSFNNLADGLGNLDGKAVDGLVQDKTACKMVRNFVASQRASAELAAEETSAALPEDGTAPPAFSSPPTERSQDRGDGTTTGGEVGQEPTSSEQDGGSGSSGLGQAAKIGGGLALVGLGTYGLAMGLSAGGILSVKKSLSRLLSPGDSLRATAFQVFGAGFGKRGIDRLQNVGGGRISTAAQGRLIAGVGAFLVLYPVVVGAILLAEDEPSTHTIRAAQVGLGAAAGLTGAYAMRQFWSIKTSQTVLTRANGIAAIKGGMGVAAAVGLGMAINALSLTDTATPQERVAHAAGQVFNDMVARSDCTGKPAEAY